MDSPQNGRQNDEPAEAIQDPEAAPEVEPDAPDPDGRQAGARTRYQIVERDGRRLVVCGNAPNVALRVERGLTVNEQGRKQHPEQTIFLDGVFAGAPFYDNATRQYSLDHHVGCVRAYTLATCEQAVVMLLQGLPLDEGDWTLLVNEPDLDALLAAWILINHAELMRDDGDILREAMPLIRVEGVIDAHGPDMEILTALTQEEYEEHRASIEQLLAGEKSIKAAGRWGSADWVAHAQATLSGIDELLFPEGYLDALLELEELGRLPLQNGKLAVLCRSHQGIYAVEAALKARYEKQLAIIVLELGDGRFTLRQADPFLDPDLTPLYETLNQKDLRARQDNETENQWGGSSDIGGSPRKTGSALSGEDILELVGKVYGRREGWLGRIFRRNRRP
jgi:hypothetical protein